MLFFNQYQSSLEQWRYVFWITLIISMFRILVFIVWGSAEVQPWNMPKRTNVTLESGLYTIPIEKLEIATDKEKDVIIK